MKGLLLQGRVFKHFLFHNTVDRACWVGQRVGLQVQAIAQQTKIPAAKPGGGDGTTHDSRGFLEPQHPNCHQAPIIPTGSGSSSQQDPNFTPRESH